MGIDTPLRGRNVGMANDRTSEISEQFAAAGKFVGLEELSERIGDELTRQLAKRELAKLPIRTDVAPVRRSKMSVGHFWGDSCVAHPHRPSRARPAFPQTLEASQSLFNTAPRLTTVDSNPCRSLNPCHFLCEAATGSSEVDAVTCRSQRTLLEAGHTPVR